MTRHDCERCGSWECSDCGRKKSYASRWSLWPQVCPCGSRNGSMLPMRHTGWRASSHDDWKPRPDWVLRYPLEADGNPTTSDGPEQPW